MKHHTTLLAIIALLALGSVTSPIGDDGVPGAAEGTAAEPTASQVSEQQPDAPGIYGAAAATELEIRAGLELFARAGLDLPELAIYVHDSPEACGGWLGLFDADGSGHRIDLCGNVLLHELAHAWEHHHMADATRQAFLEHANLEVWNDHDTPHPARGIEHAANVIAWGVNGEPLQPGDLELYAEHLYRYELLTGKPSPRIAHLAAAPGEVGAAAVSLEPAVTVLGSPAQQAAVAESLATFASLGMALPDLNFRFHDTAAGCDGHKGLFDFSRSPWTLEICSDLAFVIPHEIGHAWERAHLSAEDRATYMEARGIATWQDLSLPMGEQGIEDIAFTIQKAILQGPTINPEISAAVNLLWELAA